MRKCGCPFRLHGYFHASEEWHLTVVSGLHNHVLDKNLEGCLVVGVFESSRERATWQNDKEFGPTKKYYFHIERERYRKCEQ
jgi:hypothetical protein